MPDEQPILTFRDLETWQAGMDLVVAVYRLTQLLPASEKFVLSPQMRRCAISIPANVAEGQRRRIPKVYLNHVSIALGSEGELETQIEVALRLALVDVEAAMAALQIAERVRQLLNGLRRSIAQRHGLKLE
jgi:four helix bundle protein